MTRYSLNEVHKNYLLNRDTLAAWAGKTLAQRCILFHRACPEIFIKPWRLSKLYKENGIKLKVMKVMKLPSRKSKPKHEQTE